MIGISGIYYIVNRKNGTVYVGSSNDCHRRFREHKSSLNNNRHVNRYLQHAWTSHGKDSFDFQIIEECHTDLLYEKEQTHFNLLQTQSGVSLYNLSSISKGVSLSGEGLERKRIAMKGNTHTLGFKHSEESKKKMSNSRKGVKKPDSFSNTCKEVAKRREASKVVLPAQPYLDQEWVVRWKNAQG